MAVQLKPDTLGVNPLIEGLERLPVPATTLAIFGATGDLARRKILPSLFRRQAAHQMPAGSRVIGAARTKMSKADFRKSAREALTELVALATDRRS